MKEVGQEVNIEKTKYMLLSHQQNSGQNQDINIAKNSFENAAQFKYSGMTLNLFQKEIKRRLISGNACSNQSRTFCLLAYCLKP
jgi:predicted HTH domain antitoxin